MVYGSSRKARPKHINRFGGTPSFMILLYGISLLHSLMSNIFADQTRLLPDCE